MASPYSDYTDERLLAELESTDEYIKAAADELGLLKHNDDDSDRIDGLESDIDHAVADYNWMKKELFDRGFVHNSLSDTWTKKI